MVNHIALGREPATGNGLAPEARARARRARHSLKLKFPAPAMPESAAIIKNTGMTPQHLPGRPCIGKRETLLAKEIF